MSHTKEIKGLKSAELELPKGWRKLSSGKVRELYVREELLLMLSTDRVSAFDKVLDQPIPYKGAVLSKLSEYFLKKSEKILPNWLISCPGPQLMLGHYLQPFLIECVVRGHISGHAWRRYEAGDRHICGHTLPDGLYPHAELPKVLFTPTTKASIGEKDRDISESEILSKNLLSKAQLHQLRSYSLQLYEEGASYAQVRGMRLLDAKYEFGCQGKEIYLIDELHTPDSARYCSEKEYQTYVAACRKGESTFRLRQLSKEWLREQLLQQRAPTSSLNSQQIHQLSKLYRDIYEKLTETPFSTENYSCEAKELQEQVLSSIRKYNLSL